MTNQHKGVTMDDNQRAFLGTAGLIYALVVDDPASTQEQRIEALQRVDAIVAQARCAGFGIEDIADAMRLPVYVVTPV